MASKESLWDEDEDSKEQAEEEDVIEVDPQPVEEDNGDSSLPEPAQENTIVRPVENIDEVVEVYDQFEEIKKKLLSSGDVTSIGKNNHINKSGWRKIATAFNLSVTTLNISKSIDDGVLSYTVLSQAQAPNGKTVTGTGMCASNESNHMELVGDDEPDNSGNNDIMKIDGKWRRLKPSREVNGHNIMATAETRAKNRAISDLVGGGEVSAEEMKSFILE